MAAEQYSRAHQVLAAVLAPAWFHERRWGKLHGALALLRPHAAEVHSDESSLSYATGAGLYELYLTLRVGPWSPQAVWPSCTVSLHMSLKSEVLQCGLFAPQGPIMH